MRTNYPKHIAKKKSIQLPYSEKELIEYVQKMLKDYNGKTYYNKHLHVNIALNTIGIKETAQKCANNRQAASLALYLPYILRNAKPIELHLPVISKKQKDVLHFTEVAKMICSVQGVGVAKLIIGYRSNGEVLEYSITNFQKTNKSIEFEFDKQFSSK